VPVQGESGTRIVIHMSEPLEGDYDAERRAHEIPASYVLKGMFFSRLVERLGSGWGSAAQRLSRPPRAGRYLAFSDYPQSDYERLSAEVARKLHPAQGLREAVRRLARDDFDVFAESTFGRVLLAVVGDARSALLKVPYVYSKVAPGDWQVSAEELDGARVRIEFVPNFGSWEYLVGQIEGIVVAFGGSPTLSVELLPGNHLRIDVRHAS
jgi:uncharacterized protein (TIGR02265 family)